jgi:hypothetical protein
MGGYGSLGFSKAILEINIHTKKRLLLVMPQDYGRANDLHRVYQLYHVAN